MVHIKDGKYVSPKKNVNFKKISLLTASAEDRCFQRLAKKAEKKQKCEIILSISAKMNIVINHF